MMVKCVIPVGGSLPALSNPAAAAQILDGYDAVNNLGVKVTGTKVDYEADYINAFDGSGDITTLPAGLTALVAAAFQNRTNLKLTSLPSGFTTLAVSCFYDCTGLALTSLPAGVQAVPQSAFRGCAALALTALPAGCTISGVQAFLDCTGLVTMTLPLSVVSLPGECFSGCTNLETVVMPRVSNYDSVASDTAGQAAFNGCTKLTTITFGSVGYPVANGAIGSNALYGCTKADLVINVYTANGLASDIGEEPWGGTNATVNFYHSTTGVLTETVEFP